MIQKPLILALWMLASLAAEAQKTLNTDSLLVVLPETSGEDRVRILNDLCWGFIYTDPAKAYPYGMEAVTLAESMENQELLSMALGQLGVLYAVQSSYEKSLNYFLRSLEINRKLGNPKKISSSYGNISGVYHYLGDHRKALIYLNMAHELNPEKNSYWNNAGAIYVDLNKLDSALILYEKGLAIANSTNDTESIVRITGNIGDVHLLRKNYDRAIQSFDQSYSLAKEHGMPLYLTSNATGLRKAIWRSATKTRPKNMQSRSCLLP